MDVLKNMRTIDDKIIYALNTTVPTQSFAGQVDATETCKDLHFQLEKAYSERENAIRRCISHVSTTVNRLLDERTKNPDSMAINRDLRKERTKLQQMQMELNVEEIVKDRSLKVFHERCRNHYIPHSTSS
ncbi:coiled-coil domain-containing protein 58-like isoform X2 [Acanthaster planci]|uniref:Protein MIX23 n=1 Tax=Acanthaster planci TaxID=133434 RepID=A0A8B7ZPU0_ACAPL|nr:coiled-coil domain-containing protein 58-like isoform X2 [Acanthaster planci]